MLIDLICSEAAPSQRMKIGTHACLPYVHAVEAHFDRAIGRKQISGFVPLTDIQVVAVATLQSLDSVGVLDE